MKKIISLLLLINILILAGACQYAKSNNDSDRPSDIPTPSAPIAGNKTTFSPNPNESIVGSNNTPNPSNTNSEGNTEITMKQIEKKIKDTEDNVFELFSYSGIENTTISTLEDDSSSPLPIYKYSGPNNTFDAVCEQLEDDCSPKVVEILIRKLAGFINVDGVIGFIATGGEVSYREFDEADMELISQHGSTAVIKITRYYDKEYAPEISNNYLYTVEIEENGNIIVIDLTLGDGSPVDLL